LLNLSGSRDEIDVALADLPLAGSPATHGSSPAL